MTLLKLEKAKKIAVSCKLSVVSYCKKKIAKQLMARRMASFVLVTAMLPMTISPVAAPKAVIEDSYKPHVVMDTNTAALLASNIKTTQIIPGESQVDKAVREKSEADAQAKAAAEAKAKADADAKAKIAVSSRKTVTRENRVYSDPSNFDDLYLRASQNAGGVDPRILRAIHQIETGGSGSSGITNHTGSGATGPMQFMPSTWKRHGVDGNGDGIADINNVEDAVYSAALYLKACGYPDIKKALWGYNPSTAYYNKVINLAHSYGM